MRVLCTRACRLSPLRLPPGRRLARTEPWSGRPAFDAGIAGVLSAGGDLVVVRRPRRPRRDEPPCERAELVAEADELTGAMT